MRNKFAVEIAAALARAEGKPMASCADGCAFWIADIYRRVLAADPAVNWRGHYAELSNAVAEMKLGQRGLLLALMRAVDRMGWRAIDPTKAAPGDFAVILPLRAFAPAIFDGGLWLTRLDGGYGGYPHAAVKRAWSVV